MRFYFKSKDDTELLTLVQRLKPFLSSYGDANKSWAELAINFNKDCRTLTGKACRDRFIHLLSLFRSEELLSLKKTGTDEDFEVKKRILTDIAALIDNKKTMKECKNQKLVEKKRKLENLKENAMSTLKKKRCGNDHDNMIDIADTVRNDENDNEESEEVEITPNRTENNHGRFSKAGLLELLNRKHLERAKYHKEKMKIEAMKAENEKMKLENERMRLDLKRHLFESKFNNSDISDSNTDISAI